MDQVVAQRAPGLDATKFRSMQIGLTLGRSYSWAEAGRPVEAESDPYRLFDKLFAGTAGNPDQGARTREERKLLLAHLRDRTSRYARGVGSIDRRRIEAHLEALRDLERQLDVGPPAPSAACASPNLGPRRAVAKPELDGANAPWLVKGQLDMAVAALACDVTRVINMQWGDDGGAFWTHPWLGREFEEPVPPKEDPTFGKGLLTHHYLQHEAFKSDRVTALRVKLETWWIEQYAYLVGRLAAIPEGNGSMLDNTAVVLIAAQGIPAAHAVINNPVIVAGSCAGYFATGRWLKLGTRSDLTSSETNDLGRRDPKWREGYVPHNRLLVSLCNAMGVPVDSFNVPRYGGALQELRG